MKIYHVKNSTKITIPKCGDGTMDRIGPKVNGKEKWVYSVRSKFGKTRPIPKVIYTGSVFIQA